MKRVICILSVLMISFSVIKGQDVKVTAAFDTSKIYLGDQIHFTVSVDQPSDISLVLPLYKDSLCKNIEILSGPVRDSSVINNGRITLTDKYLITSFDSGYYEVPPAYTEFKTKDGIKRFYSDYSRLEVMRLNKAPADTSAVIYDIVKPYRAPVTFGEILPFILLALAIGILVWVIIRLIRRFKKTRPDYIPEEIKEPAHVIAFRELEKLKEAQLWQKGEVKLYYTMLTEILRQYLENRFRVYSLELTTSETLDALVKSGFKKDESYKQLKSVLTGADLVKFAKYNPEPDENENTFKNSWEFVTVTKIEDKLPEGDEKNVKKEEEKS